MTTLPFSKLALPVGGSERWRRLAQRFRKRPELTLALAIASLSWLVLALAILSNHGYPRRDSGIYLYTAQLILDGRVPYTNAWESKPPGVFYIDALGLIIGRGSIFGVWLVESLSMCGAVFLSVRILARAYGVAAAFFGTMAWLAGLTLLLGTQGTNLTEEYAIPLKFAAFWLFLECEEAGYKGRMGFALGFTGALIFLLRQNLVGVHLAIVAYMLVSRGIHRRVSELLSGWLWIGAGALTVVGTVFGYFAVTGALADLIDIAFRYNLLYYSAAPFQRRLASAMEGFVSLSRSGVGIIAIGAWVAGLYYLKAGRLHLASKRIVALAIIAFPLEVLLTGTSTREYGHYYMAWLPAIGLLAGFFSACLLSGWREQEVVSHDFHPFAWQAALIIGMMLLPVYGLYTKTAPTHRDLPMVAQVSSYVVASTRPSDFVLVWGEDPGINFVSGRRAPTRFMSQTPLFTPGYETPGMVKQFLSDLEKRPPALIIDTAPANDQFPPINYVPGSDSRWTSWGPNGIYGIPLGLDGVFAYFRENYREKARLDRAGWSVVMYERRYPVERN